MSAIPPGAVTTSDGVRHGPQMAGSEAPKTTTDGTPNAAAMCAGPESLPTKTVADANRHLSSSSGAPESVGKSWKGERSSPRAPMKTTSVGEACKWRATSRKPSACQDFAAAAAKA